MSGLSTLAGMAALCGVGNEFMESAGEWGGILLPDGRLDLSLWIDPMKPSGPMLGRGDAHWHIWRGYSVGVRVEGDRVVIQAPEQIHAALQRWFTGRAKHQRRYARRGAKMRGGV